MAKRKPPYGTESYEGEKYCNITDNCRMHFNLHKIS